MSRSMHFTQMYKLQLIRRNHGCLCAIYFENPTSFHMGLELAMNAGAFWRSSFHLRFFHLWLALALIFLVVENANLLAACGRGFGLLIVAEVECCSREKGLWERGKEQGLKSIQHKACQKNPRWSSQHCCNLSIQAISNCLTKSI